MPVKIDQKIVGFSVVKPDAPKLPKVALLARPEVLLGRTYKLKTPLSEHALYITINDLDGRPFEVFINSKDMTNFQWIVALTRVISAIFRHGGEVTFLIEELRSVFDPKGGYFAKGHYVPSLVAAIGDVVETHLTDLGLHQRDDSLAVAAQAMVAEKTAQREEKPAGALCAKCGELSVVILDGCATCTTCGDSKCG